MNARLAGFFYLLVIATGSFGLVSDKLVVSNDAAATAANMMAHESAFRFGVTAVLLSTVCYVVVTALFYGLFKPVSSGVSLVAAFFSLVGCAVGAVGCVLQFAPLAVLRNAGAFNAQQLQSLALVFLNVRRQSFPVGILFFGFYCLLIGYLIFRSTFLPRILGALMAIAGCAWLAMAFLNLLASRRNRAHALAPDRGREAARVS